MLNKLFLKKLKKPIDNRQKVWYSIFKEKEIPKAKATEDRQTEGSAATGLTGQAKGF